MKMLLSGTASAAVLAVLATGTAHAQSQNTTAHSARVQPGGDQSLASTPTTVDEIVVTAQKRKQVLQDVPIVVTAVTHQLLQDSGVKDIKDLALLTPGLLVTSTTSEASTTARIRGIGTVGDNAGLESSVGVVIDGVYRPRNGVGFGDLGDVDQIEVLKGPQGTLFGKSTSAGVINVTTAAPQFTFGANGAVTYGNYNDVEVATEVTGPLIADKLAGSLYFGYQQRDGFFDVNTGSGPRTATTDTDKDFYTLRGQLLARPTNDLTFRFIADYSHRNELCCIATIIRGGEAQQLIAALGGNDGNPNAPYARNAYSNQPDGQNTRDAGVSLQADWKVGPGALTSITAYRDWKNTGGFDADFSTADIDYLPSNNSNSTEFRTFSQELRYAGKTDRIDYLVGGFYSNEQLLQNTSLLVGSGFSPYMSLLFSSAVTGTPNPNFLQTGLAFPYVGGVNYPAGSGSVDQYHQADNTYALFTDETFHITNKLELNTGFRYTIDDKTLNQVSNNIGGGAGCAAANASFGLLPPATAAALASVDQTLCLPFLSPGYNGFTNHQSEQEGAPTGTVKLVYRFDPRVLAYLSYARGYKAGGFNLDRVQCTVGQPGCAPGSAAVTTPIRDTQIPGEYADSYEAGVKSTLFNRKLLLNATLFYQNFTNFQLNTFNGFVFVVELGARHRQPGRRRRFRLVRRAGPDLPGRPDRRRHALQSQPGPVEDARPKHRLPGVQRVQAVAGAALLRVLLGHLHPPPDGRL